MQESYVLVTPTLAELIYPTLAKILFNSASVGVTRMSVLAMRISIYLPNQEPRDLIVYICLDGVCNIKRKAVSTVPAPGSYII